MKRQCDKASKLARFMLPLLLLPCFAPFHSCGTAGRNALAEQHSQLSGSRVLIIFYDKEVGDAPLLESLSAYDATLVYSYKYINGMAIAIPPDKDLPKAMEYYRNVKGVLSVERDRKLKLMDAKVTTPTTTMRPADGNQ